MTYSNCPGYHRVSTVADAVARVVSESLMFAGARWASQRAVEISREILVDGHKSPFVEVWHNKNPDQDVSMYLASDWYESAVMGGVTRMQQGTKDRGTLLNKIWDKMNDGEIESIEHAIETMEELWDAEAEAARIARVEYEFAVSQGLIEEGAEKPSRGYQCTKDDVAPYVTELYMWFDSQTLWMPKKRQGFVKCDTKKICGTYDDLGLWRGQNMILDLKSATTAQPGLYNVVQVALYWYLLGSRSDVEAMNLIVTPSGVHPRIVSNRGLATGLKLAWNALDILDNKSMSGLFLSVKESTKEL